MFEVLRPQRERDSLKFDEGLTATGTQTKNNKRGRLPDLDAANETELSKPARAIIEFATGDSRGLESLVGYLGAVIQKSDEFILWKIGDRSYQLARIAVHKKFIGRMIDKQAAELMGVSVNTYRVTWSGQKLDRAISWLNNWEKEAINYSNPKK